MTPNSRMLSALLARCEAFDGHPALPEPQRAAVARRDLGAHGARAVLGYEGGALVGCALITPATMVRQRSTWWSIRFVGTRTGIKAELIGTAVDHAPHMHPVHLWLMQATDRDDDRRRAVRVRPRATTSCRCACRSPSPPNRGRHPAAGHPSFRAGP